MDDKITPPDDTAEYKFNESEGTDLGVTASEQQNSDSVTAEEMQPSSRFSLKNINWKRFAAPGIVVLSIMVLYGAFSFYASRKTSMAEQQKIMSQGNVTVMQQPIVLDTKPKAMDVGVSSDQITQMQNTLQQEIDNMVQQIKNSQDSVSSLNSGMSKTQQDIATIGQQVEQLTMAMQQMLVEMEKLKAKNPSLDPNPYKPKEKDLKIIGDAFKKAGETRISPAYEILGGKYPYEELRLARLFL